MQIIIGSDHAGFLLKEELKTFLKDKKYSVTDAGTYSADSVDYPDFAHAVAGEVEKMNSIGILICGSGNGVAMAANKHQGIRAALCWTEEIARLARQHNNANILCLPARFISRNLAVTLTEVFLSTAFEGGRHERRVAKINC
ncbi:MAG: ribose 5-phosphate isomerase B [Bacteroidia bacterium]|nr:ribose 5-phosphate isomerase B [Bacteroidia bacterium]MCZ2278403.1 ribose 5-phosphate isomerase B [Bacteroidia bacterium]